MLPQKEAIKLPVNFVEIHQIKRLLQACIREKLFPYERKDKVIYISLPKSNKIIVANEVKSFALEKFKINGEMILISGNQSFNLRNIPQLLNLIHDELQDFIQSEQWQAFVAEINNGVANDRIVTQFVQNFRE